jgi:hypothetical protein
LLGIGVEVPMSTVALIALTPYAAEIPYDRIDQDGDGQDLTDVDRDGASSVLAGGSDCNDRDARIGPHSWDWPNDGADSDCDGWDDMHAGAGLSRWIRHISHGASLATMVLILAGLLLWSVPSQPSRT